MKKLLLLIALLSIPLVQAVSQDYIYLIRPATFYESDGTLRSTEYLSSDDLLFYAHVEYVETVNASLYCLDQINTTILPVRKWENYSFIVGYDLERSKCSEIQIQVAFERNDEIQKLTQDITVRKYSSIPKNIIDYQYDDGGWETPVSTAYALWALKNYKSIYSFEIGLGLQWLKNNRDNRLKCWPRSGCTISDTAKIYSMLSDAGYNTSLRIMHDSKIWLEEELNQFRAAGWSYTLNSSANLTSCVVTYEGTNYTMTVNDNQSRRWFNASYGESVGFICTEALNISLLSNESYRVFTNLTSNISYQIPRLCWARGRQWEFCNIQATLFATVGNLNSTKKQYGRTWLSRYLVEERGIPGKYINSSYPYIYTPLFLYANSSNEDLASWVLYRQNNDGSWGSGSATNRLLPTAYSILALQRAGYNHSEFILDAKEWIYTNEETGGWSNMEKNALSFRALEGYTRLHLKANPRLIVIDRQEVEVDIYNPTTFNMEVLTFTLPEALSKKVTLRAVPELDYDSYKKITFLRNTTDTGEYYGYLSIKNNAVEVAKVPVIITKPAAIALSAPKKVSVFNQKGTADFAVTKTPGEFICTLSWEQAGITAATEYKVNNQTTLSVDIQLVDNARQEKTFSGRFTCTHSGRSYPIPFSFIVDQYPSKPFTVYPSTIAIVRPGEDGYFSITNDLEEDLAVTISFETEEGYFEINNARFTLGPKESKNLTIISLVPEDANVTSENLVIVKALDATEKIKFSVNIGKIASGSSGGGGFPLIAIIIVGVIIGGLGFAAYWFRAKVIAFMNKYIPLEKIKQKLPGPLQKIVPGAVKTPAKAAESAAPDEPGAAPKGVDAMGRKQVDPHLLELIRIMRNMGKDDDVIKDKLKKEGFPEEEIDTTFKDLSKIEEKEEKIEKEKNILKIMESLEKDRDQVVKKLKEDGFTDDKIDAAFKEIEDEAREKEAELEKKEGTAEEEPQEEEKDKKKKKKDKKKEKKEEKKE